MSSVLCIILNWRTPDMTLKSVESALKAMDGVDGAINVVDNDSQDGSYEKLCEATKDWPRVQVLQSGRNGGYGAGNNFGIQARLPNGDVPDYVYVLNSDAFPEEAAIRELRDYLDTHPKVGFAGSYIYDDEVGVHTSTFRFPSIASEFEGAARTGPISKLFWNSIVAPLPPKETTDVQWIAGASFMTRQCVLDEIGVFDETFFLYFEETDLCRRAAKAGWITTYVVESRVVHLGSVSTGMREWERVPKYWFESRRHYFVKNHGRVYAGLATLAHAAGLGVYALRALIQRKKHHAPPHFLRDLMRHAF